MLFLEDKAIVTFSARNAKTIGASLGLTSIMTGDKAPHAAIFEMDLEKAVELVFLDISVIGIAFDPPGSSRIVVLDEEGEVRTIENGEVSISRFETSQGPLRQLKYIGGSLFAIGTAGQVYRKDPGQDWREFGPNTTGTGAYQKAIFTDIDGFSADDLYVAGTEGTIWHWKNDTWVDIYCATNLAFLAIHCAEDGVVYACGQTGVLAQGRDNRFEITSPSDQLKDLWGIQLFNGKLYCASVRALMVLENEQLVPCLPAMEIGHTFYGLDQAEGMLWSVGEKDVLRFDGTKWQAAEELDWVMP